MIMRIEDKNQRTTIDSPVATLPAQRVQNSPIRVVNNRLHLTVRLRTRDMDFGSARVNQSGRYIPL